MNSEEALEFVNRRLTQKGYTVLSRHHAYVFQSIWDGKTYQEMCVGE